MSVSQEILNRTGARNTASVPADVLKLLNAGKIESVNLCEWLVIDQLALAKIIFKKLGWQEHFADLKLTFETEAPATAPKKTATVGRFLTSIFTKEIEAETASNMLLGELSDTVRSWGAYLIGLHPSIGLERKFQLIRPYAADQHMAVREIAWLATRACFIESLSGALDILPTFTNDPDANIRRFASELTRPRGVWCPHIQALKDDPTPGINLLEPLKSDPSNYVRLSVGNWLNDASKSAPALIRDTCARWDEQSPTKETAHILRRALRTLAKG